MTQIQTLLRGYRYTCSPVDDDTVCWLAPGQKWSMLGGPGWRTGKSLGCQGNSAESSLWEREGGLVLTSWETGWGLCITNESHHLEATENPAGLWVEPVQPLVVLLILEGRVSLRVPHTSSAPQEHGRRAHGCQ